MKKQFKIGDFVCEINYPKELPIPEKFLRFETKCEKVSHTYEIQFSELFPEITGNLMAEREDLLVLEENGLEKRFIGVKNEENYYAYSEELKANHTKILLKKDYLEDFSIDPIFTSLLSLEKRLLLFNSIVLHTAYIEHNGQAILFSAPSETGKTTQANLWEKYRSAKTINGDRSLLSKIDGTWHAGGWPVCGTSEICNDITMPIKAIVMLSQAPKNHIERLHPMKAFSQVYSQITINRWNTDAHNKAMNLIEALITEVPVYHLACNISEDAVKCLESVLNT